MKKIHMSHGGSRRLRSQALRALEHPTDRGRSAPPPPKRVLSNPDATPC